MLVLVPFHLIDTTERADYFKICVDASAGKMVVMQGASALNILRKVWRQDVHAHGRGFPFPEMVGLFARRSVYTPHFNTTGHRWWTRLVRTFLFNRFDYVIAQTEYGKRSLVRDGVDKDKIVVLPTPVDYELFSKPSGGAAFRKRYGLRKNEKVAIAAGARLFKNPRVIADACRKAGVRLVITGAATKKDIKPGFEWLLPPADLLNDDNIVFTGMMPYKEMVAAYDAADVFVNSSDYESFGIAVYEAAAAGKPLCLPDIGTFEAFKNCALFHRPKDTKTLAKNIGAYLDDKKLRETNAKRAKEIAKRYDYSVALRALEDFYKKAGFI